MQHFNTESHKKNLEAIDLLTRMGLGDNDILNILNREVKKAKAKRDAAEAPHLKQFCSSIKVSLVNTSVTYVAEKFTNMLWLEWDYCSERFILADEESDKVSYSFSSGGVWIYMPRKIRELRDVLVSVGLASVKEGIVRVMDQTLLDYGRFEVLFNDIDSISLFLGSDLKIYNKDGVEIKPTFVGRGREIAQTVILPKNEAVLLVKQEVVYIFIATEKVAQEAKEIMEDKYASQYSGV